MKNVNATEDVIMTGFIDDVLNKVKNELADGEYATWSDFCVVVSLPKLYSTEMYSQITIWGEEDNYGVRSFSIYAGSEDDTVFQLYTNDDTMTELKDALAKVMKKMLADIALDEDGNNPTGSAGKDVMVAPSTKEVLEFLQFEEDTSILYPFAVLPKDVKKRQLNAIVARCPDDDTESIFLAAKEVLGDNPILKDNAKVAAIHEQYQSQKASLDCEQARMAGLCADIGKHYGENYIRTRHHLIIEGYDRDYIYRSEKALLRDWLNTLIEGCYGGDDMWKNDIPFVVKVTGARIPGISQAPAGKSGGPQKWKASVDLYDARTKDSWNVHLGTYFHMTDAIMARMSFLGRIRNINLADRDAIMMVAKEFQAEAKAVSCSSAKPFDSFLYDGVPFYPVGRFLEGESFKDIVRNLRLDPDLGICRPGYTYECKHEYVYEDFIKQSPVKDADIFYCPTTGRFYVPCTNDLQVYTGAFAQI